MPEEFAALKQRMAEVFNVPVQMTVSANGKGKISISFASQDELERIMRIFDTQNEQQ